ncbi:putative SCAN domain-containing protein SCAND2P isoform X2 [Cuculus canorus]|nr:putative SCAN domain-containing protein SCAND2P isoform X2 [Cuculus canorus]
MLVRRPGKELTLDWSRHFHIPQGRPRKPRETWRLSEKGERRGRRSAPQPARNLAEVCPAGGNREETARRVCASGGRSGAAASGAARGPGAPEPAPHRPPSPELRDGSGWALTAAPPGARRTGDPQPREEPRRSPTPSTSRLFPCRSAARGRSAERGAAP